MYKKNGIVYATPEEMEDDEFMEKYKKFPINPLTFHAKYATIGGKRIERIRFISTSRYNRKERRRMQRNTNRFNTKGFPIGYNEKILAKLSNSE